MDGSLCAVSSREISEAGFNEALIKVFNTESGELVNEIMLRASRGCIAFDRGNNLTSYDTVSGRFEYDSTRGITIRDIYSGSILIGIESDSVFHFEQNPSSDNFAAALYGGMVRMHNGQIGGSTKVLDLNRNVESMAYSPNGKCFLGKLTIMLQIFGFSGGEQKAPAFANAFAVMLSDFPREFK